MEKTERFETVDLPSKGLLYPSTNPASSGKVRIKYPTAKEEDILTNINYIKSGTVFDKLMESVLLDKINISELLLGDKNAILVGIRVLAYGKDYKFLLGDEPITVDITSNDNLKEKILDESLIKNKGINEFYFTLPNSGVEVSFKLTTSGDEEQIDKEIEGIKKIRPKELPTVTTRLKHILLSVNGQRDTKTIREFVDEMLTRDTKALREYINNITPNIELTYKHDFGKGLEEGQVPINIGFFWPES